MARYEVNIRLTIEANFQDTIEAESEVDAEDVANERVWNDIYAQEINSHAEIVDESYEAEEEMCKECDEPIDDCICEDKTDDYKGYNRRKSEWESARGLIEDDDDD
jgi:hypothetical protein